MDSSAQNNIKEKDNQINDENNRNEHNNKGKYNKKSELPNFLLKLYNILENEEYKNIIQWGENGQFFIIKNIHNFTEKILPKYFKHKNYSSFIRQLNMYDFHKKKSNQNEHLFYHQYFIRNQKDSMKEIKRKSNKKNENIPIITNPLDNNKYTDLVKYSCKNALNDINTNVNINKRKSSLPFDEDANLNNSIHSLFEPNKRPYLPYDDLNLNVNSINNENYSKKENLNCINIVNNFNKDVLISNNSDKKITKQNINNLLYNLNNDIMTYSQIQKNLEMKIERLSKQNENFILQNEKMLNEIISKKDYNNKLEAIVSFILDMIMTKPNINNYPELENILFSKDSNKKLKTGNCKLNLKAADSTSSKPEITHILPKNNYNQISGVLEPFQSFLNTYLEKSKKTGILIDKENNSSNMNSINTLKNNLICSKNESDNTLSNSLISKKRKRSNSLNSLLSDLSNGTKIVYSDNKNKNKFENTENFEKIEEQKSENESLDSINDKDIMNNIEDNENENYDSFFNFNNPNNKFDFDISKEENKMEINDISRDILNNSLNYLNDSYNRSIITNKGNDVFSY